MRDGTRSHRDIEGELICFILTQMIHGNSSILISDVRGEWKNGNVLILGDIERNMHFYVRQFLCIICGF